MNRKRNTFWSVHFIRPFATTEMDRKNFYWTDCPNKYSKNDPKNDLQYLFTNTSDIPP